MENNPKIDGKRVSWDSQIRKGNPTKNAETREPELIEIGSDEKTKESNLYEAEKQQMEEPNKKSTRKQEKFSSSGSETQEKEKGKTGSINCLCLYNTYEPDMAILGNDKLKIEDTEDDNAFHSFLKLKL